MIRRSMLVCCLVLAGCAYGFAGGGLPSEIKTVAVMPFENLSTDPTIAQEVNESVREAIEDRLGLRNASEEQADVIVTGTVRSYEPDQPVSFRGAGVQSGQTRGSAVEVSQRSLRIDIDIEMIEVGTERNVLRKKRFSVRQQYDPGNEAAGRREAMARLIDDLVEEAQKQW
jgi:hypothetical protein